EAPDPGFESYLRQLIQQNSLQDRVRLTGWLSDQEFFNHLGAADVTVNLRYPSRGEESGSLTRILGCGRPTIVSNFAQYADIPKECVIHVNFSNEVADLDAALERLWSDAALRESLSQNARTHFRTRNDVDRVASSYYEASRAY